MRRTSSQLLLGPATLLYLLAQAAAAQGELDGVGVVVALFAGALCLAPIALGRSEATGARRVGLLGLASALALPRLAAPDGLSLTVDLVHVLAVSALGGLVLELALSVPEIEARASLPRQLRLGIIAGSCFAAAAGVLAHAPAFSVLGQSVLAPTACGRLPTAWLVLALWTALFLRISRRRFGASPEALASNAWAVLGLVPACALALLMLTSFSSVALRLATGPAAVALVWGHARLLDPTLRLRAGGATRDGVAFAFTLGCFALLTTLVPWPADRFIRAGAVAGTLLAATVLFRGLRRLSHTLLAPVSGRLLTAVEDAERELAQAGTFVDVARILLAAARRASGSSEGEPLLWLIEPKRQFRIDAAGQPHEGESTLPIALERALRERPGELIVRGAFEAQIVRAPALRPLIDALSALDMACVVPLVQQGELEGALCLPRARRRSALSLEELDALTRLARYAAGFLGVLAAEARAQARASVAFLAAERAAAERGRAVATLEHTRAEADALRASAAHTPDLAAIAYDPKTRSLLERLAAVSDAEVPVWLTAERGIPVADYARWLHARGKRAREPFLVCECTALRPERAQSELMGEGARPGLLALAAGGTLHLQDLTALPAEAQAVLAAAVRDRQAVRPDGERYEMRARLVVSTRQAPAPQEQTPGVLPALRSCFPLVLRVPALRERPADLPSLILLALDRATRTLGRSAVGLEPTAQSRLLRHDWPGNLDELFGVVERAVAHSQGPRVLLRDLPLGPQAGSGEHPLDGSLDMVERRVLKRALERCSGNKSETARLLGLKRTTLIDKLRRHGLDDAVRSLPPPPKPPGAQTVA